MLERNSKHIIDIESLNHEGQGVGRINNFIVFVPDAVPGETIEAVIIKPGKSFAVARRLKTINHPDNTDRTDPFCSSYLKCGGCSMQHIAYEAQLRHKCVQVEEALSRVGGFSDDDVYRDFEVSPVLGMSNPKEYRNKAQFPIGIGKDMKPEIGFYSLRTHKISDGDECGIHHPSCDGVRRIVRGLIIEDNIKIYDEIKHEGWLRHLIVRVGVRTGEVMVILVCNGKKFPEASKDRLVAKLSDSIKGFKSLWLNVNTQKSNIITGEKCIKLWGSDIINERIGPLTLRISPLSFFLSFFLSFRLTQCRPRFCMKR
jgi:23S rRNA (uracil1939-C5)-methyltransferase